MENLDENVREPGFVALVGGATGACGRAIIADLVNNPGCKKVFALTRSEIADPVSTFPTIDSYKISSKLVVHKLDWAKTNEAKDFVPPLPEKPSVGFCAMGSAPYTEESDFTMPVAFATAARKNGVDSMFLVSSMGAKTGSWFGYIDTLGRREDAFKALGFRRLGIYRPGMMDRHEKQRFPKEYFKYLMPSCYVIDTHDISKTMVESALRMKEGTFSFSHDEMKKIAAKFK
jgi:oxidoreductase